MKKKVIGILLSATLAAGMLMGGGLRISAEKITQKTENDVNESSAKHEEIPVKTSPDKYTWYIKDYVGKNLASFGYTSMGGDRMDHYGAGYVELALINQSGKYIDIGNEEELKKYVVVDQSVQPNTEIKFVYQKDENGNEYDNLISSQTVEEVLLYVKEVGSSEDTNIPLTQINPSLDVYTHYVRDYVGRNLNSFGYLSLGGQLRDAYGPATVKFVLIPDDGSYIDIEDEDILKKYMVTEQNISPNTEIKCELLQDEEGNEYDNLVENQNIEEIELHIASIEE